jgi:hypothetical protein
MLIPPPRLNEELWVCVRRRWRKGQVVVVKRKTLRLALLRPMPENPLQKEVSAGWAYVATAHELRREPPTTDIAPEWTSPASGAPPTQGAAGARPIARPSRGSRQAPDGASSCQRAALGPPARP